MKAWELFSESHPFKLFGFIGQFIHPEVLDMTEAAQELGAFGEAYDPTTQLSRKPKVIGIQEGDELPTRVSKPEVPGRSRTRIVLPVVPERPVDAPNDLTSRIGGAIVHYDDLDQRVTLAGDAIESFLDEALAVVYGHDHADQTSLAWFKEADREIYAHVCSERADTCMAPLT
jgi:hypothetical protein